VNEEERVIGRSSPIEEMLGFVQAESLASERGSRPLKRLFWLTDDTKVLNNDRLDFIRNALPLFRSFMAVFIKNRVLPPDNVRRLSASARRVGALLRLAKPGPPSCLEIALRDVVDNRYSQRQEAGH